MFAFDVQLNMDIIYYIIIEDRVKRMQVVLDLSLSCVASSKLSLLFWCAALDVGT